jgi:hypothetical protein
VSGQREGGLEWRTGSLEKGDKAMFRLTWIAEVKRV